MGKIVGRFQGLLGKSFVIFVVRLIFAGFFTLFFVLSSKKSYLCALIYNEFISITI